ncbi:MAG: right-handed parallel beta-helix repeat-containing protein [Fimbriimonadaceae bacterium]|nr:right-handed parallel beta-helix repeat-containing protein [Fimbriimonadaceae bacterium]
MPTLAVLLLWTGLLQAEPAVTLHVALTGADTSPGTAAAPFATLEGARDAVRKLRQAGPLPTGGVTVLVHAGTYQRSGPLQLGAADAGTAAAPIEYRAAPGERVVLTGARRIVGWQPHQGAVWKADVAAQGFRDRYFRQLFLDGRRQHLARYPNYDPGNPHGGGFAYVDGEPLSMYRDLPTEELRQIHTRPPDARTWAHPELAEVILFPRYNWINMALPVTAADPAAHTITLGREVKWGNFQGIRPLDRYYVRNLPEELDAPGEWWLDRESWQLYYWPPQPLERSEVRAPVAESLIELSKGADCITIRGFVIEGCDGTAVNVREAQHCRIVGNTVHDTGGRLGGSAGIVVSGGRDVGVVGNDVYEVCNDGIRVDSDGADREALTPTGHFVDNNYVHHIGVLNGHGCGITVYGIGNRVSHNLIHDTTRCGIYGGGTDCVVEYNRIRHVNLETEDTGGTYMGAGWHVRGMVYRYNFLSDILGYGRTGNRWTSPHFAWGIYLDDDLSGVHVHGNIVARTTLGGSHIHAGRDNLIENNIFVDGANQQMQYSGHEPESWVVKMHLAEFEKWFARPAWQARYPELAETDRAKLYLMAGNRFERNIVSYRSPTAWLYRYSRNDAPETNTSDYNLIWHHGTPPNLGLPNTPLEQQWAAWQQTGQDVHSQLGDPLFVDAAHDDYRLQPNSPALALGFQPIPVEQIGPYASPDRATWPIVEAPGVREIPLVTTVIEPTPPAAPARPLAAVPRVPQLPEAATGWPQPVLPLSQHPDGSPVASGPAALQLCWDGSALGVQVTVPILPGQALRLGHTWEQHDAAEVCWQDLSRPGVAVFVSHGYADGTCETVVHGGGADLASPLQAATRFRAAVQPQQWLAGWHLPLTVAGLTPRTGLRLAFNVGVRRAASNQWLQWCGSGSTYSVERAGILELR